MIHIPFALKLHSFGLMRIHDATWCGEILYDYAKRHYRGRSEPKWLFQKTLADGFLYQLGRWLFTDYIEINKWTQENSVDHLSCFMEDYVHCLISGGISEMNESIHSTNQLLNSISHQSINDEELFNNERNRNRKLLHSAWKKLNQDHCNTVAELSLEYASNYAERVFHDRELCWYLSNLILEIGIDGTIDDESPSLWCERRAIPEWAKKAIYARDRGKCTSCGTDLLYELGDEVNIDHMIPLFKGGCNDLVNLQLLCSSCNSKKSNRIWLTTSSIPPYLKRKLKSIR